MDDIKEVDNGIQPISKENTELDAQVEALLRGESIDGKRKRRKRGRWKKILLLLAVLIVLAVIFVPRFLGGNQQQGIMVAVSSLTKGDVVQTLAVSGPVSGTDSVDVVSNIHAEILDIMVKEGDKVVKDQVLATLDKTDLEKEVTIAQNKYNLEVSNYNERAGELQNSYEKAVQDYNIAKTNYDRMKALFDAGDLSQVDLEAAENTMRDAERQVNTYRVSNGKVRVGESYSLQIESAKFDLEQKKEVLQNAEIKSPISGTVIRVYCKVGRFADKTEDDRPMFSIENLDVLEIKINVSEYSIGNIKLGQKAKITADILNGEFVEGEVVNISPTGEEKGGGSTERVIPVTIRILDNNTKLIAGINAKAEIVLKEAKDTFVIPTSSIIQLVDGNMYIQTVTPENTIKLIQVETGVESDFEIEIFAAEGYTLEENMSVLTNPNMQYYDGMPVTIMPSM